MTDNNAQRLRTLQTAARTEPLYWTKLDNDEQVLTDRHGRQLDQVRAEGALALELARRLVAVVEAVVAGLTPGRTFGPTLERRLRTSIKTLTNVYERDNMIADELEQGWEEEAEKRAQLQAEKGAPRRDSYPDE